MKFSRKFGKTLSTKRGKNYNISTNYHISAIISCSIVGCLAALSFDMSHAKIFAFQVALTSELTVMGEFTCLDNFTAIVLCIAFGNNAMNDQVAVKLSRYKMCSSE